MNEYKNKYLKYKSKYLKLKIGVEKIKTKKYTDSEVANAMKYFQSDYLQIMVKKH